MPWLKQRKYENVAKDKKEIKGEDSASRRRAHTYSGRKSSGRKAAPLGDDAWPDGESSRSETNLLSGLSAKGKPSAENTGLSSAYESLGEDPTWRHDLCDHSVFIVHKGWKEDNDIVSRITEQLLASPQKIQSVTLATTRPKSTVAMSTYPANKSEPDVSVDHADAIDGFERALDEQKQAVARGAGIATAGMPRLLALKRGLLSGYSTPPPVRAAMAHSMAAGTSQRSFSLGKTAGRRFKEKAGAAALAYNDDVKLMISRFMSAKVIVIVYDRLCQSSLPDPLATLACLQRKFIVPLSMMGRDGLMLHLGERGAFSHSCSQFFFASATTKQTGYSNVVSYILSCLSPCVGNPLSLRTPPELVTKTATTISGPTKEALEVPTGNLIGLSPDQMPSPTTKAPGMFASFPEMPANDFSGFGTPPRSHFDDNDRTAAMTSSTHNPEQQLPVFPDSPPSDQDRNQSALPWLNEETSGDAIWRYIFPDNPDSVNSQQLQEALGKHCHDGLSQLFRRDRARESALLCLVEACMPLGDDEVVLLSRQDFCLLVQEEMTASQVLLEKAMEIHEDNENLDTLTWLVLARRAAEIMCAR